MVLHLKPLLPHCFHSALSEMQALSLLARPDGPPVAAPCSKDEAHAPQLVPSLALFHSPAFHPEVLPGRALIPVA